MAAALDRLGCGPCLQMQELWAHPDLAALWDREFGGWERVLDREHAIARYERHNQEVKARCPPDRLVELAVSDGWVPLCRALAVGIPDESFPHLNQSH